MNVVTTNVVIVVLSKNSKRMIETYCYQFLILQYAYYVVYLLT